MNGTVLDLRKGRTARWTMDIVDATPGAVGYTATLSGAVVTWRAKHDRRDVDASALITKVASVTQNGDATHPGIVVVTVDDTDSAALSNVDHVLEWSLTVVDGAGKKWEPLYGPLNVILE